MKIAINCSICQPKGGGITEYIVNLTRCLEKVDYQNEYVLYVLEDMYDFCLTKLPNRFKIKKIPFKSNFSSVIKRSLFSQKFWYKEEQIENFELFHSPFFYAPKFKHAKLLLTVHDLRLYRFPSTYGFLRYIYLQHSVKESIKRADQIISISQFTKNEIIDTCNIDSSKIKVVLESINREKFNLKEIEGYQLSSEYININNGRFLLTVGHIEPRKNYERLLDAFEILKKDPRNKDLKLVIVGKPNNDAKRILRKIKNVHDVIYLNFIPHELLIWLYKNASLFVFPSYYEGFGFPPMEAGSLGTLSVVSNVSSIPEVCGECSIYFNPYDINEMVFKINEGLYNKMLIEEKKNKIGKNLNRFSWEKNAKETLAIYEKMIK